MSEKLRHQLEASETLRVNFDQYYRVVSKTKQLKTRFLVKVNTSSANPQIKCTFYLKLLSRSFKYLIECPLYTALNISAFFPFGQNDEIQKNQNKENV